jgi:glutamine synthetase
MTQGGGFDGSSVGFKHVNAGDMGLNPDLWTAFVDPFHSQPTLACLCSVHEADTKELYQFDPREIARRAEKWMISTGIADQSLWGPEFDFYIFDRITLKTSPAYTLCQIDSGEANWERFECQRLRAAHNQAYQAAAPCDNYTNSAMKLW